MTSTRSASAGASWTTRAAALVATTAVVLTSGAAFGAASASAATSHHALPVAKLAVPKATTVGSLVTVRLAGSKAPAHLAALSVDFGDHTKKLTAQRLLVSTSHRYTKPGHYTITLRLTDKKHHLAKTSRHITVRTRKATTGPVAHGLGAAASTETVAPPAALDTTASLPASVDLTGDAVPVGYQGAVSSCVAWAIDYAMYGWYAHHQGLAGSPFAPMYAYSQINGGVDGGSHPQDALKLAQNEGEDTVADYGAGSWNDWQTKPTAAQRANAANYRIAGYTVLFSGNAGVGAAASTAITAQLAKGSPVAISIHVPNGMTTFHGAVYSDTTSAIIGGHEVLALGYDASGLLIQNSWGTAWGSGGFVRLSWDFVQKNVYEADVIAGLVPRQSSGDAVAPTVTAPAQTMVPGTTMNSYGAPVTVSWSGSDNSGTVASYSFWASTDGAAWAQQTLQTDSATSVSYHLTPGHTYKFAVQARDAAGNTSQWGVGDAFRVDDHAETDSNIRWSSGWQYLAWNGAQGGQIANSTTPEAWAYFTFTGSNVAWISDTATNRGQARVYIDGKYVGTPDLYSATTVGRTVEAVLNAGSSGTHTVEIDVVGTSGRPNVDVDSFIVLS